MKIKYIVFPGYVISNTDGQKHYIGARELMILYNVNPNECIVVDINRPETYGGKNLKGLTKLYPNKYGIYDKKVNDLS